MTILEDAYREVDTMISNHKTASNHSLTGIYRARVEYNKDDQQLGRVKVRVPQLHGIPKEEGSLDYLELPWAYPCTPFPSGYDHGSFIIPEVGSYVWVIFEANDPACPVYIGSMYAKGATTYQPMGTLDNEDELKKKYSNSKGRWNRPGYQSEVPQGVFDESSYEPNTSILYKSPKGATIEINENDEEESFTLLDRLGQIFKFISPVTKECNGYNAYKRAHRTVEDESQFDTEDVSVGKKALILVKDARSQFLRFVAKKGKSKIDLVSKDEDNTSVLNLNAGEGKCLVESKYGDTRVSLELDAKKGKLIASVIKGGKAVSSISLDEIAQILATSVYTSPLKESSSQPVSTKQWVDTKDELSKGGN